MKTGDEILAILGKKLVSLGDVTITPAVLISVALILLASILISWLLQRMLRRNVLRRMHIKEGHRKLYAESCIMQSSRSVHSSPWNRRGLI